MSTQILGMGKKPRWQAYGGGGGQSLGGSTEPPLPPTPTEGSWTVRAFDMFTPLSPGQMHMYFNTPVGHFTDATGKAWTLATMQEAFGAANTAQLTWDGGSYKARIIEQTGGGVSPGWTIDGFLLTGAEPAVGQIVTWQAKAKQDDPPPPPPPVPDDTWTKAQIVAWLADHGVVISAKAQHRLSKAELLEIVAAVLSPDEPESQALLAHYT